MLAALPASAPTIPQRCFKGIKDFFRWVDEEERARRKTEPCRRRHIAEWVENEAEACADPETSAWLRDGTWRSKTAEQLQERASRHCLAYHPAGA
jgi:hypothetical protein